MTELLGGLHALLRPPFTIGDLTVTTEADVLTLLLGDSGPAIYYAGVAALLRKEVQQ